MLYFPWYNENTDLLGGYSTYEEHYHHVHSVILSNERKYSRSDIEDIQIDENGYPEHAWNQLAPGSEANRAESLEEGSEVLTEMSAQDLMDSANLFTSTTTSTIHARFEGAVKSHKMSIECS